jgi:hypothetical protein
MRRGWTIVSAAPATPSEAVDSYVPVGFTGQVPGRAAGAAGS